MTVAQRSELQAIFGSGVCDWTRRASRSSPWPGPGRPSREAPTPPLRTRRSPRARPRRSPRPRSGSGSRAPRWASASSAAGRRGLLGVPSPTTLSSLSLGPHTFRVRAIDPAGNVDPTPASQTFTVTSDTPPTITTLYPGDAATGTSRTTPVVAIFNQAMDKPSAESAFSLKRTSDGATVRGSFGWLGNGLGLPSPSSPLANGTSYTATVSTAATDNTGNPLPGLEDVAVHHRHTAADRDGRTSPTTPPRGIAQWLRRGGPSTRRWTRPRPQAAFSLKRTSDGAPVGGSFGWYRQRADLQAQARDLAGGTQYTAAVAAAAKDLAGHPLPAAKSWRFTTTNRPIIDSVYSGRRRTRRVPQRGRRRSPSTRRWTSPPPRPPSR